MSDQFLAEIRMFGGNFAPRGWAMCNGQLLAIQSSTALFSLLGTTYGGNGTTIFALPNLQGMTPMHAGNGAGLTPRALGETSGEATVTLIVSQMPAHTHTLGSGIASGGHGGGSATNTPGPTTVLSNSAATVSDYAPPGANNVNMSPLCTSMAGGSLPHNNLMPYLGLTFIIAVQGIFPARN